MELIVRPTKLVSVNQCYRHAKGRVYMTSEGRTFKSEISEQVRAQLPVGEFPTKRQVRLSVRLVFPDKRRRDIDNYCKLLFDACNGLVWVDDCQIVTLYIEKGYERNSPLAGLTVELVDAES